jgi:lysophospholipase L1-like esterase
MIPNPSYQHVGFRDATSAYPSYHKRAREYCKLLAAALHRPEEGVVYCDLYDGLMQGGLDGVVISDGKHLSDEGHRRLASIVAPVLKQLMSDCEPIRKSDRLQRT